MKRLLARFAVTVVLFAGLAPATTSFADTSLVTLSITAAPVTRASLVYVQTSDGSALVLTTSTIAELP